MPQKILSNELAISLGEVSYGLKRLKAVNLINSDGLPSIEASIEFLISAVKYICPVQYGTVSFGMPTAHSHKSIKSLNNKTDLPIIWEDSSSKTKGQTLIPIYPTVPASCLNDKKLYQLLALVEMTRIGRARDKKIAETEISRFIKKESA